MTALNASTVPLAVRIKNSRYDGLVTGYLHGAPKFTKTDPGGFRSGSFTIDQRLAHRSDIIQPYSRVQFFNKRNGDVVFEGDITHPGRSVTGDGPLLEVTIEGGAERLNDWSGPRIYCDSDLTAWEKNLSTSNSAAVVEAGDDRGGSGFDALILAIPSETHVETNYRSEAIYRRIVESGQQLGRINYSWDTGLTNASWLVRLIVSAPSVVARASGANVAGGGISAAYVGPSWTAGANFGFLQFIWTSTASNTGTTDVAWASIMELTVVAHLWLKDGTRRAGVDHDDSVKAVHVIEDLLGDPNILSSSFDGPNADLAAGASNDIRHLVFPDGITPAGVMDELMKFEPKCTYIVGPSNPASDKYSLTWLERSTQIRYEFIVWTDEHSGGVQPADQFNEAVSRWKTPTGNIRFTTSTQAIPEMDAVGRKRRYFQDLGQISGDATNATTANASVLEEHRYPSNGGRVRVQRDVVDLFTGRSVQPYEIEPGYLCRVVGVDPSPDALNATESNGASVCRIVTTDYSADDHSVDIDLDSVPWSMFRAIAQAAKPTRPLLPRPGPGGFPTR